MFGPTNNTRLIKFDSCIIIYNIISEMQKIPQKLQKSRFTANSFTHKGRYSDMSDMEQKKVHKKKNWQNLNFLTVFSSCAFYEISSVFFHNIKLFKKFIKNWNGTVNLS